MIICFPIPKTIGSIYVGDYIVKTVDTTSKQYIKKPIQIYIIGHSNEVEWIKYRISEGLEPKHPDSRYVYYYRARHIGDSEGLKDVVRKKEDVNDCIKVK